MNKKTSGGTNNNKDVIYIDVDDEITSIIDKVEGSSKKIVALVLPKRALALQSIVNMKLLKRAATDSQKNVVLITSEHGLLPLAGSVGLHVAKSLSSRPEIPEAPTRGAAKPEPEEEPEDVEVDGNQPVGKLSGDDPEDEEESIEMDNEEKPADDSTGAVGDKTKNKKFKIPNFNKFRVMLVVVAFAGVALIGVIYAAVAVWPRAEVIIKTDRQSVTSSATLTLKIDAGTQLDVEKNILPAQVQEVKKTITQEAPATGQKNNGEKAEGTAELKAKKCDGLGTPQSVPAGTGLSIGGKTYITQKKVTFSGGSYDGTCLNFTGNSVAIVAQNAGASFNTSSASVTVSGRSDVSGTGSASGGTDDIITVVSQADVDGAKGKITDQDIAPIRQELSSALIGRNIFPVESTLVVGEAETTLSAEVNAEADKVIVTQTITYTMWGVAQGDLEKIVAKDVNTKIDTQKQSILSYGLDDAYFSIQGVTATEMQVSMRTEAVAGAALNTDEIRTQVAGKKGGDAKNLISVRPGVTGVEVKYSPFWVSSIPKKTDKITVTVEEPTSSNDSSSQ